MKMISFGALAGFAMVCHFYLREQRRSPEATIEYLVLPLLGTILYLYFLFPPVAAGETVGLFVARTGRALPGGHHPWLPQAAARPEAGINRSLTGDQEEK